MYKVKDIYTNNSYVIAITEDEEEIPFIRITNGKIVRLKHYNVLWIPMELHDKITNLISNP